MSSPTTDDILEVQKLLNDHRFNPPLHDFMVYDPFLGKAVKVSEMSDEYKKQIVDKAIKR